LPFANYLLNTSLLVTVCVKTWSIVSEAIFLPTGCSFGNKLQSIIFEM
jgi:hypothetical protein